MDEKKRGNLPLAIVTITIILICIALFIAMIIVIARIGRDRHKLENPDFYVAEDKTYSQYIDDTYKGLLKIDHIDKKTLYKLDKVLRSSRNATSYDIDVSYREGNKKESLSYNANMSYDKYFGLVTHNEDANGNSPKEIERMNNNRVLLEREVMAPKNYIALKEIDDGTGFAIISKGTYDGGYFIGNIALLCDDNYNLSAQTMSIEWDYNTISPSDTIIKGSLKGFINEQSNVTNIQYF